MAKRGRRGAAAPVAPAGQAKPAALRTVELPGPGPAECVPRSLAGTAADAEIRRMEVLSHLWLKDGRTGLRPFELTEQEHEVRRLIETEFDRSYYLITNGDVCTAGMDPLCHFVRSGRFEGRHPASWFDPAFYRAAHPEVEGSGLDPFSFFLRVGRAQGHATQRQGAAARSALDQARTPALQHRDWPAQTIAHVHAPALLDLLRERLAGSHGLTVSVSHDRYLDSIGGVQILIASEQAAFNARRETYLHVAPALPLLTLAPEGEAAPLYLHLTVDGAYLGATTGAELLQALDSLAADLPTARRMVVHSLLGHRTSFVAALHGSLRAGASPAPAAVFWLHDYATICTGYNLLRNDVAFCDAPPAESAACHICVYGDGRHAHLAAVKALFEAVPFHVAAPSTAALAIWQRRSKLPHLSAQVSELLRMDMTATRRQAGAAPRGGAANPIRLAFVGHPAANKGWHAFCAIAEELRRSCAYRLFHFSSGPDQALPGVTAVAVRVTAAAPGAMTEALAAAGIDLVLVLSPWPETFCIVASEALAAGADILTLDCSGNVANLVRQSGRGCVFPTAEDVAGFLTSPDAMLHVRARLAMGSGMGQARLMGGTAALTLPSEAPVPSPCVLPDLADAV